MTVADNNAEEALTQLNEAKVHQKKSGKCMIYLKSYGGVKQVECKGRKWYDQFFIKDYKLPD